MRVVDETEYLRTELHADRSREQQADLLEQAADLILQITADADQAGSGDEERAGGLAGIAFDPDLTIPADPDELGEPSFGSLLFILTERTA